MEYKYLFTVIVPIYNVEDYLEEAILSVVEQDIGFQEHIQLILVNDGSPDNCEQICLKYRDLYPDNVIYLRQENAGVSAARNAGIPYIQGKYVNFLDSDDKWAPDVFSQVHSFFEEHGEKIDVVCCRMQFFEAQSGFHMLDYKFSKQKPKRIINILKSFNDIQMHAASSFFRTESLDGLRFDPQLKYGEDSLFLNQMVLKKRKFGALYHALYFLRRRANGTSAIQNQTHSLSWYFVSPERFLGGLAKSSISLYGSVLPYIQSILFYDIGYRLKNQLDDTLTEAQKEDYIASIRTLLQRYISDQIIFTSHQHRREIQILALRLKYGSAFDDHLTFTESAIFFDNYKLVRFASDKSLLKVNFLEIRKNKLHLEGTVRKWLLDLLGDSPTLSFRAKGISKRNATWSSFPIKPFNSILGPIDQYVTFRVALPLDPAPTKVHEIKALLHFQNCYFALMRLTFGRFSPISHELPDVTYRFFGKYLVELQDETHLRISVPKHRTLSLLCHERAMERKLRTLGVGHLNRYRRQSLLLRRFHKKKIYLVSDRSAVAGDNGEAFFKYLTHHCPENVDPYFVIDSSSPDFQRMQQYGKVIPLESKKKLVYTLAADAIIDSSGANYAFNPFGNKKLYVKDLLRGKYVFLQHGITKDDVSNWLHKTNKNIRLFITAALPEYQSILTGDYGYTEREVALTGFARYDTLLEQAASTPKQKQLLILPTWRKSIERLPAADPEAAKTTRRDIGIYRQGFRETEFYQFYQALIQHPRLLATMKKLGYTGLFALHPMMASQASDFQANEQIQIHTGFLSYSQAFAESSILLTDYSSVAFDFVYLKRPVVYTQFDKETFYASHTYDEGYFNYERDGFGPVCTDLESTVDALITLMEQGSTLAPRYLERIDRFYAYTDDQNCRRTLEAIEKLG